MDKGFGMDGQMNLESWFSTKDKDPISNATCVIKDGVCIDCTWEDLFDSKMYDTVTCVTYVSSPSFFHGIAKQYKKASIIIGIEKEDVRKAFLEGMNAHVHTLGRELFENMSDEGKDKVIAGDLTIRYAKPNCIIHSKFFLLSSTKSQETRLIFGSANMTKSAFDNHIKQYEDIMVFDNSPLFDTYIKRFNAIMGETEDYIPREVREKYKEGKIISVADLTAEELTENLFNTLEEKNLIPVCNEELMEAMQAARMEEEKESTRARATFEIISEVSKKKTGDKTGQLVMKKGKDLEKAKEKITDILFRRTKTEASNERFTLTYNDADKKQYRVYTRIEGESVRDPEVYDRCATQEEIKRSLENVIRFIDAYRKYVTDKYEDTQELSRIFEAILYSFISAYIFILRQKAPGGKADVPLILVIGGKAFSGKSNLLAYIDRIMSGRKLPKEKHYYEYKNISKGGNLGDLFLSDNTYPLLVDEVPTAFFTSKSSNKGEELIKYLSNTLEGKHPAMICTTNTSTFSIPRQVSRRIYFIKVDACFDEKIRQEASDYYDAVMDEADNHLFRDFCCRMSEKIKVDEELFGTEHFDYLRAAREIFIEYFSLSGIDMPDYFPKELYNDYDARGRYMWGVLYEQEKKMFSYDRLGNGRGEATLTVNIKELVPANKDTQTYINYIRPDILIEEAGMYVVLRANAFYDWIGVRKGLFKGTRKSKKP